VVAVEIVHSISFSKAEGVMAAGHDGVDLFSVGLVHSGVMTGVLVLGEEAGQTGCIH